jgi:hypothetical protein
MRGDSVGGRIRWRIHLPVPPEQVFAALDSDQGRSAFWAASSVERNEQVELRFSNGYTSKSRIIERRAPSLFILDYIGGPVRFDLSDDGSGGTDLLLTHDGIAPKNRNEVHAGWLNVLFPLKAWLSHGVDLRNHDPRRSWDQGYADQELEHQWQVQGAVNELKTGGLYSGTVRDGDAAVGERPGANTFPFTEPIRTCCRSDPRAG